MEFVAGMANNLKLINACSVIVIITMAMLVHCSSSVLIVSPRITSQNGHPHMLTSAHKEVPLRFANVNTVACVARKFIEEHGVHILWQPVLK